MIKPIATVCEAFILWLSDDRKCCVLLFVLNREEITRCVCVKVQTVCVFVARHGEAEDSVCGFSLSRHHQCGG